MSPADFSSLNLLSDLVFYRTYAGTKPSGFKETYDETVDRVMQMHMDKFPKHTDAINSAFSFVRKKIVMPSMRTMQFAGDPIKREHLRGFNCTYMPFDTVDTFGDIFYALACGCGVGFSVQRKHVNCLPEIERGAFGYFVVPDNREGWADSFKELVKNPSCEFVYGQIRSAGSILSTGGTASGPEPLKRAHDNIRKILKNAIGRKLRPIEVHDIACHIADSVVVGGVRRSACISLFDAFDEEMLTAKSGKWWEENPQRGRSNNSAVLLRTDQNFNDYFYECLVRCFDSGAGEPGLSLSYDNDWGFNPCQPAWATVLTPEGIRTFADISEGSVIWSGKRWTKVLKKWSTGVKPVFKYYTTKGYFEGTENHRIVQCGEKVEVGQATQIDASVGPYVPSTEVSAQDVMDGLVIGDGTCHKASNNLIGLYIGDDDQDYWTSEVAHLISNDSPKVGDKFHVIKTSILPEELPKTYERGIPSRFFGGSVDKKCAFLRGLYSANGSVVGQGKRITLKSASKELVRQVQLMLSSLGIASYITTNAPSEIEWSNGTYTSKESYDLNITSDRFKFLESVGFIQSYKTEKVQGNSFQRKHSTSEIYEIESLGEHEVFDITVEDEDHTYWTGGCLVSNCHEVALKAVCNLTEINAPACATKLDFLQAVNAATFIGKLQSTYTDFGYMQPRFKAWAEEERLLGVSITGQADAWGLIGDPSVLAAGAAEAIRTDEEWSAVLGVGLADRIGTTKPSGTTSLFLGTSSGIHAAHARHYLRRVRIDESDPIARYLISIFGVGEPCSNSVVERDKFAPNNIVVSVPVNRSGSIFRTNESAIQLMERAKHIYKNWILPTHRKGPNSHNVSLTVNYKPGERGQIINWMMENKDSYSGISLLPYSDSTYVQMPFEEITLLDYAEWKEKFLGKTVNFSGVNFRGTQDKRSGEMACSGGACELKSL